MSDFAKIPFTKHLEDLRRALVYSLAAAFVGFVACFAYAREIFDFLAKPLISSIPPERAAEFRIIYTGPTEAFFTDLKVAFLTGLFLASPVVFWQIWSFIAPGLYKHEKRAVLPLVASSSVLFLTGALFCYFVVLPAALNFFAGFITDRISFLPSMKEYLTFTTRFMLAFGLVFQMPLLSWFFSKLGLLTAAKLSAFRRYAIVINFIVAAVLTPGPDILSQLLMAGPLLILYEVSILVSWAVARGKANKKAEGQTEGSDESQTGTTAG